MKTLPVARQAAYELCQDLCEFVSRRYPTVYTVERSQRDVLGWYGDGSITKITMSDPSATYDLQIEDSLFVRAGIWLRQNRAD